MSPLMIVLAAVVYFFQGFLWYSGVMFGPLWMKELKIPMPKMDKAGKRAALRSMSLGFLFSVVTSYVMANFHYALDLYTLGSTLQLGFFLWLGFMLPSIMNGYLWEGKSLKVVAIALSRELVGLLLICAVLFYGNPVL